MSADTFARQKRDGAIAAVVALVACSALAAFTVQAWFAYGFARHVWTLPDWAAPIIPIFLDLFVATLMVITYLLRDAEMRTRVYIWSVLFFGVGLQVAASESFAAWSHYGTPGRVASFGPALILAATLHTLIIVVRHRRKRAALRRPVPRPVGMPPRLARQLAADRGKAWTLAYPPPPPPEKERKKTKTPVRPKRPIPAAPTGRTGRPPHPGQAEAVARVQRGERLADVAAIVGVDVASVRRWAAAAGVTSRSATAGRAFGRELQDQLPGRQLQDPDAPDPKKNEDPQAAIAAPATGG